MKLASRLPPICLALFAAACAPAPEGGDAADVGDAAGAQADAGASASTATAGASAGEGSEAAYFEWPEYRGNLAAQRYSPLDLIDRDNVSDLRVAWRWYAGNYGPRPEQRNQVTPLMINGVLYAAAGTTRNVVAIDPATGETLWVWRPDEGRPLRERAAQVVRPRAVVLVGRAGQRAAHRRDAGLQPRRARSRNRPAGAPGSARTAWST